MFHIENKLRFIEPQLASPVDQPPGGKQWIHEIKYEGFRCQVLLERGWARVFTRNGHDWSDRYSSIVRAASDLRCRSSLHRTGHAWRPLTSTPRSASKSSTES